MRRFPVLWMSAVLVISAAGILSAADGGGTIRGTVASVVPMETPEGRTLLMLVLKGEGIWQATVTVAPENKAAFAAVSGLKAGDRVTLAWVVDGGRAMVREIVRGEGRGEGENKPRAEGERERNVEKPAKEGANKEMDERAWEANREREARQASKEKAAKETAEGRDREAVEKEERAKQEAIERARRVHERDGDGERVGPRDGEKVKTGPRDGERNEGENAGRMKTTAQVVGMETVDENTRVLKVKAVESGEEMSFKVVASQGKLYDAVGGLREGAIVRVQWKTEQNAPVLVDVSRGEGKRER